MSNGIVMFRGRQYKTVGLRVQQFRQGHPVSEGWSIRTELIHRDRESVCIRAALVDPQGREIAVGHAEEQRTSKGVNSTSALENCETSAIGRALAAAGYAGTEYASADELANALNQQQRNSQSQSASTHGRQATANLDTSWTRDRKRFVNELKNVGVTFEAVVAFCEGHNWGNPSGWDTATRSRFLEDMLQGQHRDLYDPDAEETTYVPDPEALANDELTDVA